MKQIIDLRSVYHRREDRVRAHVLLCWLALLLIRIAETTTGQTWPVIRDELQRLPLGTFAGPAGTFRHRLFGDGDRLPASHPAARHRVGG